MSDKILTVVIPAYNVEKYIEKCLNSFINLEVLRDLEIIVVNDGSTDHTAEKVQPFCDKYPSSIQMITKENGGHGSGINCGIAHATGKYFKVVDGDDWVVTENLTNYIKVLKSIDADVVANNYFLVQDGTEKILEEREVAANKFHYNKEWGFAEAVAEPIIKIHAFTIKTEILKENAVKVDEKTFYEDAEYILYPIPFCKSVYYDATPIYMYRLGRNGQSVDMKSMVKRKSEHEKVLNSLLNYYRDHQFIQQYKLKYLEAGIAMLVENQFQIFLAMAAQDKEKKAEAKRQMVAFDKLIRHDYPDIYEAVKKKSVWALRHSNYGLFPVAVIAYKIVKR